MYESFFRFRYRPFAVLPNTDCIFWTEGHRNAFSVIEVGLDRLSQLTVLTGGIGTGKTTLIRRLLQTSSDGFSVGLLSNFAGDRGDLLPWVLSAFGLNFAGASEAAMFRRLERYLAGEINHGRRSVLIIDEAQNLSEPDLETLRLLSNLNADQVLMMLVLVGQPQLRAKMTRVENKRLCQRIGADYHLEPLTREDTSGYIRYRCVQAGGGADLFAAAACDEIHRIAAGVPRKINVLCDLALISAFAEDVSSIDLQVVQSVVEDARRHGTYTSLTEHDIVPLEESRMVVGGGTGQMAASEFDGYSRDPLQRLTLVLEAGGGVGRHASVRPSHHAPDGRAARPAERRSVPSSAEQAGDLNALLDMAWSDDSLLFIEDPAEGPASAPASDRPDGRSRGDHRPGGQDPLSGGRPGAADGSGVRPGEAAEGFAPRWPGQAATAAAGEAKMAPDRAKRLPAASAATGSPAEGAEVALRRAFAPPTGWRRIGWRGAAGMAALAASGSMAAGIAIALLPGGNPPLEPQPEVTELWTETGRVPPELSSRDEPTPARAEAALAGAPDSTLMSSVAAVAALRRSASGGQDISGSPMAPADIARPRPAVLAEAGYVPDAPADAAAVRSGSAETSTASGLQTERTAPARLVASPFRQTGSWNPPEPVAQVASSAPPEPTPADAAARAQQQTESVAALDPDAAFRHALDVAIEDSRAAVIAYARAAMLGHERAAYYLGQIYETGDGVPIDLAIARHWYEVSSAGNARARDRLAELPQPERSGKLAPPQPLLAEPSGAGHADFVWTSGQGADPASYVIELSTDPRDGATAAHPVSGSAARLPLAVGAGHWRVLALDGTGGSAASDWRELSPAIPERAAAAAMPAGRL